MAVAARVYRATLDSDTPGDWNMGLRGLQHRLALFEYLVADLLGKLLLDAIAAEAQLLAAASVENAVSTVGITAIGIRRAARQLAHQRILHGRRTAAAQVVILDAKLQHA